MTRDRLPELLRRISNSSHTYNRSFSEPSGNVDIETSSDNENALDAILNDYREIRIILIEINSNLEAMSRMVQITNIRNFNENELDELRLQNIQFGQKLIQKFSSLKKELPNLYDDDDDDCGKSTEARIKISLFYGLHQNYLNLWRRNEEFLLSYETKLKKHLQFHTKILNFNASEEEVEELIANKTTSLFVDNILEDTERERQTLRELMERFSELKKLEKSIEDVHALFMRIQNLVIEQNDLIQVIEWHSNRATGHVDKGKGELCEAKILREKTLKKKTCLIATGIIVLILIIFLIFMG